MASLLRGDFDFAVSLSVQIQNTNEALIALTNEQYRCLDQLDDNPRCLIRGAAGTGKTLLALQEAMRFTAQGDRVALFCYNNNLADWMSSFFTGEKGSVCPAYVGSFHKFMRKVAEDAGMLPPYPSGEDKVQTYFQKTLPEAAALALLEAGDMFDAIIIDEAQDLIQESYLDVLSCCLRKGLERGRWTMFGDFSMQAIYSDQAKPEQMIEMLEERTSFIRFRLTKNCRNTKQICREIETVTGFNANDDKWTTVDGPPVQYLTWNTMEKQREKLESVLLKLEGGGIQPDQITILSPRKREYSVVSMVQNSTIRDFKIPKAKGISFSTVQGYKGLENTVIILTDIEDLSSEKLLYVGLSRACSVLYVLESEKAKREYDGLMLRRLQQ